MKKNKQNILIIAAHPDDEVLGCGGTIYNLNKLGHNVSVLYLSDGVSSRNPNKLKKQIQLRKKSAIKSCKILGIKNFYFENLNDNSFDAEPMLKIVKIIEKYIFNIQPKTIFTHSFSDLNIDHQITNKAVVTACRPTSKMSVKKLYFFEILSSTEWNFSDKKFDFNPNYFEDITTSINKKILALKAYKDELRNWPHPRSIEGARTLAKYRGMTVGLKFAEAFVQSFKIN